MGTTEHKSVFLTTVKGEQFILKVDLSWFEKMNDAEKYLKNHTEAFNASSYFEKIVFKYLGNNCKNCRILITKLLSMADADANGFISTSEAITFGSLLLTRETFLLAAMNETKSIINFYGYCGPLYIVEKVHMAHSRLLDTSKAFTDFFIFPNFLEILELHLKSFLIYMRATWKTFSKLQEFIYIRYKKLKGNNFLTVEQRVDFVIGMVEVVYDMVSLDYGEMFSCDLHLDNIGFSNLLNFSLVKQTDLDEVFAAQKVFQDIKEKRCDSDSDCVEGVLDVENMRYHDECSTFCQDNGFCSRRMKKDNLVYLCETLFTEIFFNPVAVALSDQELSKEMRWLIVEILSDCRKPVLYPSVQDHLVYIRNVSNRFHEVKQLSH